MKSWVLPIAIVAIAELAAHVFGIHSDNVAAPSSIAVAGWRALLDGSLALATTQTLWSAIAGVALGGGLGLSVSILFALVPALARLFVIPVEIFRPIPSVAVLPIALLLFGFGFRLEISIVAFACFWPVLIIAQSAIGGVEPRLLEVGRSLRLSPWASVTKLIVPAAAPGLFIAFRLAVGTAMIVAVTVEIAMNPLGLGYDIMAAQQSFHADLMYALVLWIGLLGWGLNASLLFVQRRWFA